MSELQKIRKFLDFADPDGVTNREKIRANQTIIRRTSVTDKSKSYEDAGRQDDQEGFPPGIVLEDGKLIGFGIHILNPDIYPIKEFEIYFRNCALMGAVDLSDCPGLLYVDLYHNKIEAVQVKGDTSLQILGVQDNRIASLDVSDLVDCKGIDAGRNELTALDVSKNGALVELYVNDNHMQEIDVSQNRNLKYLYCHNNAIKELDTTANQKLRHLDASGNPMKHIVSLAPQREEPAPLEVHGDDNGHVGLKFCPVYDAQWKETGKWQQTYFAYPLDGAYFDGWYDEDGKKVSDQAVWEDAYGTSRVLTARFGIEREQI